MSEQHTPSRIKVNSTFAEPELRDEHDDVIAIFPAARLTDARRLKACWNIAVGVPTQALQALEASGDTPLASLSAMAKELTQQRDQLLAELMKARNRIASLNDSFVESAMNPATGLIDDAEDLLIAEADQDFLNQLDRAIEACKPRTSS